MTVLGALVLLLSAATVRAQCVGKPTEHVVAPKATDPATDQELEDHYAYLPATTPLDDRLVVHFSGSCRQPLGHPRFLREAARNGHRAVAFNYANCPSVNGLCDPLQPGSADCLPSMQGADAAGARIPGLRSRLRRGGDRRLRRGRGAARAPPHRADLGRPRQDLGRRGCARSHGDGGGELMRRPA